MLLFTATVSRGQMASVYDAPVVFPKSPTAAGIDKFGDYPVNQFSGLPQISINLYEITAGALKVPITLSYHASGFRVNEKAGWAGLGWTVMAGGQITRKIMGNPDEGSSGYLSGQLSGAAGVSPETSSGIYYLSSVRKRKIDTQPDIYTYSIGGRNGKFFFNGQDNFKIALVPFSPLAITCNRTGYMSFNIRDENGDQFRFGESARETTVTPGTDFPINSTTSWLLEQMISQNGRDTVSFMYNPTAQVKIPDITEVWTVVDNVSNWDPSHPVYSPSATQRTSISNNSTVFQRTLQEINYRNGKVVFESAASPREDFEAGNNALDAVKVYVYDYSSAQYRLQKSVRFYTSYFINGTDFMSKRLRLDSLAVFSGTGDLIEKYRFGYNTEKVLPAYTSTAKDYWGYYNGKENSSLIPRMTVPYNMNTVTIGSNIADGREPDNSCMQACVLKRINFPTGGYTEFEYEANRYMESGVEKLAGGLRVKSINSSAGYLSQPVKKTYQYVKARPNFILGNYFFTLRQSGRLFRMNVPGYFCPLVAGTRTVTTYMSSPVIDIEPFDAVPVAYSKVIEYIGDVFNNVGRIDYEFSDRQDVLQTASLAGRPIISSFFYARGQLLKKTQYKRIGSNYQRVKEETHSYSAFSPTNYAAVGFVVGKTMISDESSGGGFTSDVSLGERIPNGPCAEYHDSYNYNYSYYSIQSEDNYPTGVTVTTYDTENPTVAVTQKRTLFYDNILHQQVSREVTTDSKGNSTTENTRYAADYLTGNNNFTGNSILDTMLAHNMKAAAIEKSIAVSGNEGISGTLVTGGEFTTYRALSNNAIVPSQRAVLQISEPVSNFSLSVISNGQLQKDARYGDVSAIEAYDNYSNVLQYSLRSKGRTAVIWDYGLKVPVAEVTNAVIADVAYTSFEADGKGNWTYAGSPVADITAVTGRRSYLLGNGAVTANGLNAGRYYIVSYWSKSGSAMVNNSSGSAGATIGDWTYFEHKIQPSMGSITVSGSAQIDELRLFPENALMKTYTCDPHIGITSSCSAQNIITYYEYDAAGRLMFTKDANGNITQSHEYHHKN